MTKKKTISLAWQKVLDKRAEVPSGCVKCPVCQKLYDFNSYRDHLPCVVVK